VSDRRTPTAPPDRLRLSATYRLQLHADFPFAAAEAIVPYLAKLGVSHLYLSPVLQAAPGSMHGYDVVDHSRVSDDLGGEDGLRGLAAVAHTHGLGIVVDIVPNHMAIPTPATLNRQFWDVLRHGRSSPFAHWFDVDWDLCDGRLGLPVLGEPVDEAVAAEELVFAELAGEPVIQYRGGQVFPIAEQTWGGSVADVLARQRYLLASWRAKDRTLGYRRFFDVDTLIAVRVERPDVFEATHRLLLRLHGERVIDGFRIDHPDGLADPEQYLDRLHDATGGAWVVVEKILAADEALPPSWKCDGTTGYDAIAAIQAAFAPPTGEQLTELWPGPDGAPATVQDVERAAKRLVVRDLLQPEVSRLARRAAEAARVRGIDLGEAAAAAALVAMLEHVDAYRAYVRLDQAPPRDSVHRLDAWHDAAVATSPESAEAIGFLRALVADSTSDDPATRDVVVRFQQVCGPVMAKGVEDTTFYRWARLISLNEVGGDPAVLHDPGAGSRLDRWSVRQVERFPHGLTALSTHDTKRDEDVRARLATAAEDVDGWTSLWASMQALADEHRVDRDAAYFLMQTVVGAWPITEERLLAYVDKAAREAKRHTTWTDPDSAYEARYAALARACLSPGGLHDQLSRWVGELDGSAETADLATKLVQLTMPGVPDVYQGCEAVGRALVDPDNRRPVDYGVRRERLRSLDEGAPPTDLADRKLLVTSRVLRLRRERPELFGPGASYRRLDTGTTHALAFERGTEVAVVVTRWPLTLERRGGWSDERLTLPPRRWRDVLADRHIEGVVRFADLFADLPVALLARASALPGRHRREPSRDEASS
jgi:(1->4)-alpha-D-glucan 1-alpha-D-glucosylmutase